MATQVSKTLTEGLVVQAPDRTCKPKLAPEDQSMARTVINLLISCALVCLGIATKQAGKLGLLAAEENRRLAYEEVIRPEIAQAMNLMPLKRERTSREKKVSFLEWRRYEDDDLQLAYPDSPSLEGKISKPDPVNQAGRFDYIFKGKQVGEIAKISEYPSENGIGTGTCFCNPIDWHQIIKQDDFVGYIGWFRNGTFKTASFYNGEKILHFDSAHHPNQEAHVIRKIMQTIHFKRSNPQRIEAAYKELLDEFSPKALIRPGLTASEVEALWGPTITQWQTSGIEYRAMQLRDRVVADTVYYHGYWHHPTFHFAFVADKLVQFPNNWYELLHPVTIEGSLYNRLLDYTNPIENRIKYIDEKIESAQGLEFQMLASIYCGLESNDPNNVRRQRIIKHLQQRRIENNWAAEQILNLIDRKVEGASTFQDRLYVMKRIINEEPTQEEIQRQYFYTNSILLETIAPFPDGQEDEKALMPIYQAMLNHKNWQTRQAALSLATSCEHEDITELIAQGLQDPHKEVREYAMHCQKLKREQ